MASRNAQFRERGIGAALAAPLVRIAWATLVATGLLLAAWCVDGVFVFLVWPDGVAQLKAILHEDLRRAAELEGDSVFLTQLATGTANALYALIFKWTSIHEMGLRFAEGTALSIPDTVTRSVYLAHREGIEVAMLGTQLFGARMALLVTGAPFLALVYAIALVDGLVHRAIRRVCGGRESSSLYHRAKFLQVVLAACILGLALMLPCSIDPRWVWGPGAVLIAMAANSKWRYYKKHL